MWCNLAPSSYRVTETEILQLIGRGKSGYEKKYGALLKLWMAKLSVLGWPEAVQAEFCRSIPIHQSKALSLSPTFRKLKDVYLRTSLIPAPLTFEP